MSNNKGDYSIRLDSGKDWLDWENELRIKVDAAELTGYVFNKEPLMAKPVLPNIAMQRYSKRAGIPSTAVGLDHNQAPNPTTIFVRDDGINWSRGDLTDAGLRNYQGDTSDYDRTEKHREKQMALVRKITDHVQDTVSKQYKTSCLRKDQRLHEWVENLQLACGKDKVDEKEDAREEYHEALEATLNYFTAEKWVSTWEEKLSAAQDKDVGDVRDVSSWAKDFFKKTNPFLDVWTRNYRLSKQDDIRKGNLSFRQLANDFREEVETMPKPPSGRATRGAFPATFDDPQKRTTNNGSERPGDRRKGQNRNRGDASREKDQTPPSTGSHPKRKLTKEKCELCSLRGHGLQGCYYAFPEKAPDGWVLYPNVKSRAEEALKSQKMQAKIAEIRLDMTGNPAKRQRVTIKGDDE